MANLLQLMPNLQGDELVFVQGLLKEMPDNQVTQFANMYNGRRKDPQLILLVTLLGFVIIAGVQRFITGQVGMGILYVFTAGLCFIGTIVDLVNHKKIAFEYNSRVAQEIVGMVKASS